MLFLDLRIRWAQSSDFGPNSDDLGHRSHMRLFPVGFRMHKNTDPFSTWKSNNLKLAVRLHKNQPFLEVPTSQYRVDVAPNSPKRPGSIRYRCQFCTDTGTNFGTDVHTGTGGSGIDVVPNLPKCPVPGLISYRTYRSVRYRY